MAETNKNTVGCPFPTTCDHWGSSGCAVRDQGPVIFCSLSELGKRQIEFSKTGVGDYLDRHISVWENKARFTKSLFAKFYVDAYQKIRKDLLGSELALPLRIAGARNEEESKE